MKTVVIYFTFGGYTKAAAEKLALERGASICRVMEVRDRSFFAAIVPGAPYATHRRSVAIEPLGIDLNDYDQIVIGCPVWAGYPAPAFNAIVEQLPAGKEVELFFCSGGGDTKKSKEGTKTLIEKKGCTVVSYRDIHTGVLPGKMKE